MVHLARDLIGLLIILRTVCVQSNSYIHTDPLVGNIEAYYNFINYKQRASSHSDFGEHLTDRYESCVHQCGEYPFSLDFHSRVCDRRGLTIQQYQQLTKTAQLPIDAEAKDLIISFVMVKNAWGSALKSHLEKMYATGNTSCYPVSVSDTINLLRSFDTTNNNKDPPVLYAI